MVGVVVVSHSNKLAEGVKDIALQMSSQAKIESAGGTYDGRLGTDIEKIKNAIRQVYSNEGVIILFDLGSSMMNTEMAIEFLDDYMRKNIVVMDAPLVKAPL